ncbi:MAG: CubicO group peptidase (beta-lactamase class C family) [Candidatus Poriferisodalaceae bacterium]
MVGFVRRLFVRRAKLGRVTTDDEFTVPVHGSVAPGWEPVAEEFRLNFAQRNEVGASVSITHDGERVVDLWGGHVAVAAERRGTFEPGEATWNEDTMVTVFSCTKGAVALSAHLLADRGELDLDAPVAEYWPEFATNGKEKVVVSQMLSHSAGVPAIREPLERGLCTNWDAMCDALAAEAPWWEPGTRNGYHMLTFGWTAGEFVRRVSGQSLGEFFSAEVAGPAGADFHIGLDEDQHHRVSNVIAHRPPKGAPHSEFTQALLANRDSLQNLAWLNSGGFDANSPACWKGEIGGGGGIGNGRSLADLYASAAQGTFVSSAQERRMNRAAVASGVDATLLVPTRFSEGFMLAMDNRRRPFGDTDSVLIGRDAYGHVGAGGSIGFADPEVSMSFGYAMNRMGPGLLLNERGQSLVDAAYGCVS